MNVHRQTFGSGGLDFLNPLTNLLNPVKGGVIVVPGAPAALSMGVVAALVGTVLLVASLKKKRLL